MNLLINSHESFCEDYMKAVVNVKAYCDNTIYSKTNTDIYHKLDYISTKQGAFQSSNIISYGKNSKQLLDLAKKMTISPNNLSTPYTEVEGKDLCDLVQAGQKKQAIKKMDVNDMRIYIRYCVMLLDYLNTTPEKDFGRYKSVLIGGLNVINKWPQAPVNKTITGINHDILVERTLRLDGVMMGLLEHMDLTCEKAGYAKYLKKHMSNSLSEATVERSLNNIENGTNDEPIIFWIVELMSQMPGV